MASAPKAIGARTRYRWARCMKIRTHVRLLEAWMKSYRPEDLFDDCGRLRPELSDHRLRKAPAA